MLPESLIEMFIEYFRKFDKFNLSELCIFRAIYFNCFNQFN